MSLASSALSLSLVADPKGRADRNLRSGFLISSFDYKESSECQKGQPMHSSKAATTLTLLTLLACPALAVAQDTKRDAPEEEGIVGARVSRQPPA
jgi:hypothetical protein